MNTLTTTDRAPFAEPSAASTIAGGAPWRGMALALLVWFGGVALATLVADPQTLVVFGPEGARLRAVEATGASMLSAGRGFVTVRADSRGAVRALYANGAWFVWPVMRAGCVE